MSPEPVVVTSRPTRAAGRVRRALATALAVALAAPSARAGEMDGARPAATSAEIRARDVEVRVRHLTSDAMAGRMSTEPGGFAASEYVASEFARVGLTPVGDDGGWFQGFEIPTPRLEPGNAIEATVAGAKTSFVVEKDWNPFSLSPAKDVTGPLVFTGHGITAPERTPAYDDYGDLDVKGKVVLVFRREPPWGKRPSRHAPFVAKLGEAAKRGAAALLVVNDVPSVGKGGDRIMHWSASLGVAPGSGAIPFAFVTQETARALLRPLGKDLQELADLCAKAGGAARPATFEVPGVSVRVATRIGKASGKNARNVVGLLPGCDPLLQEETVVLGAHHDHVGSGWFGSAGGAGATGQVHPGADDNASGTAALLEAAEALASGATRPKRSVLFLSFSGEEMGLLGSAHYVAHPIRPLEKVSTMVNCDMLGRYREAVGLEAGGVGTGKGLKEVVAAANAGHGLRLTWNPSGLLPSDNVSFFRKRVPVLSFFTGMHDEYHTPKDTADTIDFGGVERAARLVRDVVAALADAPERVAYETPPPTPAEKRPVIGIVPGPADGEGVAVASLVPDGPAAKAGLEEGDVIVAMGSAPIRGGGDLFQALTARAAGDVVEVRVLRGGEARTFRVTLGSR
jgi:hypothetical protein